MDKPNERMSVKCAHDGDCFQYPLIIIIIIIIIIIMKRERKKERRLLKVRLCN